MTLALAQTANAQVSGFPVPASVEALEDLCRTVAEAQKNGDTRLDGKCVGGTGAFLDNVKKTTPDTINDVVADVVVRLTRLLMDDENCPEYDTEIPQAIRLASTYTTDEEQLLRIIDIAETIEACEFGGTQSIGEDGNVASDTGA